MLKDLRYAFRTLCQKPAFALTAIVSIALAIGANSAIFSFQDALLLRPLAVQDPSTLVTVNSRSTTGGYSGFPYPDVIDIRDKNSSFDGLIAYRIIPAGVARDEKSQPQFKAGFLVSGNFFQLLGVTPYLGRGFRQTKMRWLAEMPWSFFLTITGATNSEETLRSSDAAFGWAIPEERISTSSASHLNHSRVWISSSGPPSTFQS